MTTTGTIKKLAAALLIAATLFGGPAAKPVTLKTRAVAAHIS